MATLPLPPEDLTPDQLYLGHLKLIDRLAEHAAQRHGFSKEEAEDFVSTVRVKLSESNYEIIRKYNGRSSFRTYLTMTINRLVLDYHQIHVRPFRNPPRRPSSEDEASYEPAFSHEVTAFRRKSQVGLRRSHRRIASAGNNDEALPRTAETTARDVFISSLVEDQQWTRKLNHTLTENGLSTWLATEREAHNAPPSLIEEAVRNAKSIVVLIGPYRALSEAQKSEWGAALQAVWDDPTKLLIPLLFRGAQVPSFAKSAAAAGGVVAAFRIKNPERDWDRTVKDLVKVLQHKVSPAEVGELITITEEDRAQQRERLSYVRRAAEAFKP